MSNSKCIRCAKIIPDGHAAIHSLSGSWHIHCIKSDIPERIFIQQFEDPEIEGFQEDDGATWWTSRVNEHDIEYVRADHVTDVSKKVEESEKIKRYERYLIMPWDAHKLSIIKSTGGNWCKYEEVQKYISKLNSDRATNVSKKVEERLCKTCNFKSEYEHHFRGDFCLDCFFGEISKLEQKISHLTDENERLNKFVINLEFQTNTRMQNFMVQSVYDRINKDCREALKLPKSRKGGE